MTSAKRWAVAVIAARGRYVAIAADMAVAFTVALISHRRQHARR